MLSHYRYTHVISDEDPIDPGYLHDFHKKVAWPLIKAYYRAQLHGFENIPEEGAVILACNHSGNAFPHDSFVLDQLLWKHAAFKIESKIRPLFSPRLAVTWWMRPFGLDNWWRRFGGIDQTYINFDRALARGARVIYYPEGIPGIGKGFNRRYELQPFQASFIKLAARHNVKVLPVYGVNAEYINPASLTFKWVDALAGRFTGIPFIPVPLIILALIFPFIFYFGFPANMKFFVGKPIDVRAFLAGMQPVKTRQANEENNTDAPGVDFNTPFNHLDNHSADFNNTAPDVINPDRDTAGKAAQAIRVAMQKELDEHVHTHGKKPYDLASLRLAFKKISGIRLLVSPLGWPVLFTRHFRDYYYGVRTNRWQRWMRDWDLIGYYLPFGWIFLALVRRLRKAPLGYRGIEKKERIAKEGRFIWSMARQTPSDTPAGSVES